MMYTRLICGFLLVSAIVACSRKDDDPSSVDVGYDYYPVNGGATWVYRVDSFAYDDNTGETTIDTFVFEYREQISGTYTDVNGGTGQFVSRSFKRQEAGEWEPVNAWAVLKTNLNAQRVEENVRFVKLVFPLENNKTWNGNLYNNLGEEEYSVEAFDEPLSLGAATYGHTLKVLHKDEENAIEEIKRYEIYARNVGMIYSLSDSINSQVNGSRGYRLRFTLKSYTP
jgi:hypothetical protein